MGKVSHKDEAVVTYFAQELGRRNRDKLKIKRGKVFDYLGMDLDFESCPGTMIISMIKYLAAMIEEWPEELKGCTPNPHQDHHIRLVKLSALKCLFMYRVVS